MKRTDVLVVGAGPAGATAAYHTATAGLSTLFIDRKEFPRPKVCGDGLTPRALRALSRMGVVDDSLVYSRIEGLRLVGQGQRTTYSFASEPAPFNFGAVVPRATLDDHIRRAAEGAGAEFVPHITALELHTDNAGYIRGVWAAGPAGRMLIEATLTIVADGAAGRLGRRLRGDTLSRPYSAFALRQYWENVGNLEPFFDLHMPMRWRGRSLLGYAWVFPVSATCANVGVGLLVEQKHDDGASVPDVLGRFVEDSLRRDPRFAHATPAGPVEAGPINSRMADPMRTPPGALLVGDAAGLVNVFTAEGIAYALESGELAARAATRSLPHRRLPTRSYGRELIAAYPRHWATRESSRHFRWLMALAPRLFDTRATSPELLRAVRQIVLDEPLAVATPIPAGTRSAQWLLRGVRHRAADLMRSTDRLLAELVECLLASPRSTAAVPLALASTIADQDGCNGTALVDAFVAIALLSLAESLLEDVDPSESAATTAAIVIGDCITTEAISVLSHLPDATYRLVSEAFREAGSARLSLTVHGSPAAGLDTHYAALAAPTRCATMLAIEATSSLNPNTGARDVAPFAVWYATTRLAAADLRRKSTPELAMYLRAKLDAPEAPPSRYAEVLRDLLGGAVGEARESLGLTAAGTAAVTAR